MIRKILTFTAIATTALCAGASEKLSGTPISSTPNASYPVANLFDGNPSTTFRSAAPSYGWAGLDLGEKYVITEVSIVPEQGSLSELAVIEGANNADFSDGIPLAIVDSRPEGGKQLTLTVNCSRGVRYVRYCAPSSTHTRLAELAFYGDKGAGDDSRLWQITNIPTVIIHTVNQEEPYDKEHTIDGNVVIISNNGTELLEAAGGIRERGNASRAFPKKPWRIKFEKKQQPLDAPAKAKKWTLINNYGDKSLLRNIVAFEAARRIGMSYVPYCRPVDVVLNGEYKGCYQFCDQVEVNPGRVEIEEMEPTDVEGEALTGGYFVEVDGYATEEVSWFRTPHYGIPITIKSPDEEEIVKAQSDYIANYFANLENLTKDTSPETGYRTVFDNTSFIQHMLVNEIACNTDTYWSTYMYKQRNDPRIYTGPVWDFDLGFDNDNRTYPATTRSGNSYLWDSGSASGADGMRYFAQRILTKDPGTADEIKAVWSNARNKDLSAESLNEYVDDNAEEIKESARLNFMRWPIMKEYVHMNPRVPSGYDDEIRFIKDFITGQMAHLDEVIGYDPSERPDDPDEGGIDNTEVTIGKIWAYGNVVFTEGFPEATRYEIFSIDGRLAAAGTCGQTSRNLPQGIYVVRTNATGHTPVKVAIR